MGKRLIDAGTLREITLSAQQHLMGLANSARLSVIVWRLFLGLTIAIVIWALSGPVALFWLLFTGERAKESLLSSLRDRYPTIVCHGGVGKGPTLDLNKGPRVSIVVRGEIDSAQQREIRVFLAAQKTRTNITCETWVVFESITEESSRYKF